MTSFLLSLSLSLSFFLFLALFLSLSFSLFLSLFLSLSFSLFPFHSLCLSLYLSPSFSLSLSLSFSLILCIILSVMYEGHILFLLLYMMQLRSAIGKTLTRLLPLGSRVRVSGLFMWVSCWTKQVWIGFSRGFCSFSCHKFRSIFHTHLIHLVSFHLIRPLW